MSLTVRIDEGDIADLIRKLATKYGVSYNRVANALIKKGAGNPELIKIKKCELKIIIDEDEE